MEESVKHKEQLLWVSKAAVCAVYLFLIHLCFILTHFISRIPWNIKIYVHIYDSVD